MASLLPTPARSRRRLRGRAASSRSWPTASGSVSIRNGPRPVAAPRDVTRAAGDWLRRCAQDGQARLDDPVLLRYVLWAGVDLGLPLQFHVGFGDSDIVLHRCDPARMTGFIQAVQPLGTQVMLLHCYPYHRQAGYLAHVYPHVWFDTGSAVSHSGLGSLQ